LRRSLKILSLFLAALVIAPALALTIPPPLSDEDLVERSDLVALVRVLSVTCTASPKTRIAARSFRAISRSSKCWK
jgi:hypothetical protein